MSATIPHHQSYTERSQKSQVFSAIGSKVAVRRFSPVQSIKLFGQVSDYINFIIGNLKVQAQNIDPAQFREDTCHYEHHHG